MAQFSFRWHRHQQLGEASLVLAGSNGGRGEEGPSPPEPIRRESDGSGVVAALNQQLGNWVGRHCSPCAPPNWAGKEGVEQRAAEAPTAPLLSQQPELSEEVWQSLGPPTKLARTEMGRVCRSPCCPSAEPANPLPELATRGQQGGTGVFATSLPHYPVGQGVWEPLHLDWAGNQRVRWSMWQSSHTDTMSWQWGSWAQWQKQWGDSPPHANIAGPHLSMYLILNPTKSEDIEIQ